MTDTRTDAEMIEQFAAAESLHHGAMLCAKARGEWAEAEHHGDMAALYGQRKRTIEARQ